MNEILENRTCRVCNVELPIGKFGRYLIRGKYNRRKICNPCRSKIQSEKYANDPNEKKKAKENARKSRLMAEYKMTTENYGQMFLLQEGKCKICGKTSSKTLNIDHCHETGIIRGLLCWNCNIGLGYFKDDLEILKKAINYLENYGK